MWEDLLAELVSKRWCLVTVDISSVYCFKSALPLGTWVILDYEEEERGIQRYEQKNYTYTCYWRCTDLK